MYIFVWEASKDTGPRTSTYANLDDACASILKMQLSALPDHVIRMSPDVFEPGNFHLDRTSLSAFLDRYHALLTNCALRNFLAPPPRAPDQGYEQSRRFGK